MSFFSNSQNFEINNGHFTVNPSTSPNGIDTLFKASVPEATHDSSARHPPPRCFPGTREQYVEDIIHWALPALGGSPLAIYWMKGPAGVGKSAIAQTCAERLKEQGKLGAAYFFSINRHSKNNTIPIDNSEEHFKFFTSIAYQLATVYPDYYNLLDVKIRRDKSLVQKTLKSQFLGLIVEPLQELKKQGLGIDERIPIIVDGLDECENREVQCEIVEIVASVAHGDASPLCWAFFSRPAPHIEATFSKASISPHCYKAILPISRDADKDIELYLRGGFENILRRLDVNMASPWPSGNDMDKLVRAAGGLFIYATTVLRFVGHPDSLNPEEGLRAVIAVILGQDKHYPTAEPAFAELDAFYALIMQRIPAKMFPIIHRVLAALCFMLASGAMMIANLAGMSRVELEAACRQMGAAVHFQPQPKPLTLDPAVNASHSFLHIFHSLSVSERSMILSSLGGSVSFYHKSFQDFLLDPQRSGNYCVDKAVGFVRKRTQDLTLQFERHHSWRGSELVRVSGAPNRTFGLSYPHPNEAVNCLIEARLYCFTYPGYPGTNWIGADYDLRKWLYVTSSIFGAGIRQLVIQITLYGCTGARIFAHRTMLTWLQPDEFSKLNIGTFKESQIEKRQQRNTIRPYRPATPFLGGLEGRIESGLYIMGAGSESNFWYWEINYNLKTFREIWTLDLDDAEKLYHERFGS